MIFFFILFLLVEYFVFVLVGMYMCVYVCRCIRIKFLPYADNEHTNRTVSMYLLVLESGF